MKLYIKQKVFAFTDKYDIFDVNGNVNFRVESEFLTFMPKLHLYDSYGQEQYFIKKKLTFLLAEYEIYNSYGNFCASVSQEFTLLKSKLSVESNLGHFQINGNILSLDFDIFNNGQYFGSIHKKWLSWGDSYELDIPDESNAGFLCALVIAIDNCIHNEKNN